MMQHITGISRNQMAITSLEDTISVDNPIRFIDAFVDTIDLKSLGFEVKAQCIFYPNALLKYTIIIF